ncbi:DNA polymerase epsilon subunit 3-like [Crassostrea virginica]|uniref:DNA polymerase epsilon subunit 3 n=1 Tax=Crassostrea virginica TaxID=6565 RepID=A0A8B8D2L7_CRAVI|nr:DNA polymerase epsilon subunit 3-like [Crassostrea virginica]XP_022326345.1 DNA polymerase epsilon subunit 3-like [Crassostrea virginica]
MAERPEDLNLPNAVVTRIIKDAIPDGVNVSKEARLAISKAASVFVLYATSCSNNFAMKAKRKTINANDVISAMDEMEFDQFEDPLKQCLDAYRSEQKNKKEANEKKKKEKEESQTVEEVMEEVEEDDDDGNDGDNEKDEDFVADEEEDEEEDEDEGGEEMESVGGGSAVNDNASVSGSVTGSVVEISDDDG